MKNFSIIVAVDSQNGIGKKGTLAWHLSSDSKYFAKITKTTNDPNKSNAVVMGRKTWESIPEKYRPLPDRLNIVLSSNSTLELPPEVLLKNSLQEALNYLNSLPEIENIFIIGGSQIYGEALVHQNCDQVYLTRLKQTFDCDTFFPQIDSNKFVITSQTAPAQENGIDFMFEIYKRK